LSYDNVKLWFAKNENGNIITIDDINDENKSNTYSCPMCASNLIPKATKSIKITSHFAHVDASKCNSETMIHWWFKNKFLEKGDNFIVVSDKERKYICKEVLIEQSYVLNDGKIYNPDVTVITECGNTIYFEMDYSNKKKVEDYIDIWLELKNIVVEVDIKMLMSKNEVPTFKALFYDGKCFNIKRNDTYYNTIGKFKEEKTHGDVNGKLKETIQKLDWFWNDTFRYKNMEVDIKHMVDLIDCIDGEEKKIVDKILSKQSCSQLYSDYQQFKKKIYERELKKLTDGIQEKYNNLVNIECYFNEFNTKSITIMSRLRNDNESNLIGSYYGGTYHLEQLEHDIKYINNQIQDEVVRCKYIKKRDEVRFNPHVLKVLTTLNEKYKKIDRQYELILKYNDGSGFISSTYDTRYDVYLELKYDNHNVLTINLTNESVCRSNNEYDICSFIDNKIVSYRSKIQPLNNIKGLNIIAEELRLKYLDHNISVSFGSYFEAIYCISLDINERHFEKGLKKYQTPKKHLESYYICNKGIHEYQNARELILETSDTDKIKNYIEMDIDNKIKKETEKKCIDCKNKFTLELGEIKFYNQKGYDLPKRCKKCRELKKLNASKMEV
jgi:predicted RNA-binding Zn-ribbon protein involved in translation (DUF1610 family)